MNIADQKKFICIHGHFYQPPRENAWLEFVEVQDSAHPFHDWNARITSECYGPNGSSRILGDEQKIIDIVNNYARISFNIGPTLLSWMENQTPGEYEAILRADEESQSNFSGHGSALAQVYNHIIMPLATRTEKEIQVVWGIRDFESRFNRKPEGMWLAETAVDTETLEVLAEHEVKFTIIAPRQVKSYKKITTSRWKTNGFDTRRPYLCRLPSGKEIYIFVYDGEASQAVAFKNLLADGKYFAKTLVDGLSPDSKEPQLLHIATDGESYGHHHRHGDMALAYALEFIEYNNLAQITNYGEYLEKFEVTHELQIHDNSSWSCVHGVERWRSNCGCNSGGHSNWNQEWRGPLRHSLDWLRDEVYKAIGKKMKELGVEDFRGMKLDYIDVMLDRSQENAEAFVEKYLDRKIKKGELTHIIRLMEAIRHVQLMYTSCAWFFDEISGIETVQVLQYANRAIQLTEMELEVELEEKFLRRIAKAKSNLPEHKDGKHIYQEWISPKRVGLSSVGMHYAVTSLFAEYPEELPIYNYTAKSKIFERLYAGNHRLSIGLAEVSSRVTYSSKQFCFAVVYLGQNHLIGNSSESMTEKEFKAVMPKILKAFSESRLADVIALMQEHFSEQKFTLDSLFRDDQKEVLDLIVEKGLEEAGSYYRDVYNDNYNLLNILRENKFPIPPMLNQNLSIVLNNEITNYMKSDSINPELLETLAADAKKWEIDLNKTEIEFEAGQKLHKLILKVEEDLAENIYLIAMNNIFQQLQLLDLTPDLWQIQNLYFKIGSENIGDKEFAAEVGSAEDVEWLKEFKELGTFVNVQVS